MENDKVALREDIGRADQQMEIWDLSREVHTSKQQVEARDACMLHTPLFDADIPPCFVLCVRLQNCNTYPALTSWQWQLLGLVSVGDVIDTAPLSCYCPFLFFLLQSPALNKLYLLGSPCPFVRLLSARSSCCQGMPESTKDVLSRRILQGCGVVEESVANVDKDVGYCQSSPWVPATGNWSIHAPMVAVLGTLVKLPSNCKDKSRMQEPIQEYSKQE